MKLTSLFLGIAAILPSALAFPAYLKDPEQVAELQKRFAEYKASPLYEKRLISQIFPPVIPGRKQIPDAQHQFQPPGPTDQRGPCPGVSLTCSRATSATRWRR